MYLIQIDAADDYEANIYAKGKVAIPKVIERIKQMLIEEAIINLDHVDEYTTDTPNLQNAYVSDFETILQRGFDFTIWFKNGDKYFVMVEINRIEVLK